MTEWHGHRWVDIGTELLDRQIVAPDGSSVGKVDDVELRRRDDGVLEVSELLVGTTATMERLEGWVRRVLRWVLRLAGGPDAPRRIRIEDVAKVDSALHVTKSAEEAATSPSEQRIRRQIVQRIPGSGRASG